MNRTLIIALLFASTAYADGRLAESGTSSVRLTSEPCPVPVLARLPQGTRGYYRAAVTVVDGKTYVGCWAQMRGAVHLIYDDGDQGIVPDEIFRSPV